MSTFMVRLPDSIHRHIRELARREGVSINQFVSVAVSEKTSAILTEEYLAPRARRSRKGGLRRTFYQVPGRPPVEGDE